MKKHRIIALVIAIVVIILSLASNFIPWDETPLEQTVFALPLVVGLILELPFFMVLGAVSPNFGLIGYTASWLIVPFVAGVSYAALYYYAVIAIIGVPNKITKHAKSTDVK